MSLRNAWDDPNFRCSWEQRVDQPNDATLVWVADLINGDELYRHSGTSRLYRRDVITDIWHVADFQLG